MNTKTIATTAISSILALGVLTATSANAVPNQPTAWKKCAGQATTDNDDNEWVYAPKGTCEKITGGVVKAEKPAKK